MSDMLMLVGLPASGKSKIAIKAHEMHGYVIHSSDKIREELYGDSNIQGNGDEVFNTLHNRIKNDLKNGLDVIYDACNINYKRRKVFLESLRKIECYKRAIYVATPYEKCLEQNNFRERKVPEEIIKRMYKNLYIPQYYEGWDEIQIYHNYSPLSSMDLFEGKNGLSYINQDNPHHTLTIGDHCKKCRILIEDLTTDNNLHMAALFHDIGKGFTKEFKQANGKPSDTAHYFQHHLVSAQMVISYLDGLTNKEVLEICNYIQWHMQPFFCQKQKTVEKYKKLLGEDFWNNLMILHKCDVMAH